MTPGVIRGVHQRQEAYDADPAGYEARERLRKENYEREQQALREENENQKHS